VADSPATSRGIVLVIDDEELVRAVSRLMLERLGYTALLAASGEEGVGLLATRVGAIAAVVLDMTMPGMDGPSTFVALREIDPHVPVILASGHTAESARAQFNAPEVAAYLRKPFEMTALRRMLESVGAGGEKK
jgi:two-component system, cell cycle sensor histidine kinase and response regulator CckA